MLAPATPDQLRFWRHFFATTNSFFSLSGNLQGEQTSFGHFTISNLAGTDDLLWTHVVVAVLCLPLGVYIMRRFSVSLKVTEEDLNNTYAMPSGGLTARTVMVSGVPPSHCQADLLQRHFQEAYPEFTVYAVEPAYDVADLVALDGRWDRARRARLHCEAHAAKYGAGEQMYAHTCGILLTSGCCCCSWCCGDHPCLVGNRVDALTFYRREEEQLEGRFAREKALALTKSIGVAFVTFSRPEEAERVAGDYLGTKWWWASRFCRKWCWNVRAPPSSSVSSLLDPDQWSVRMAPPSDDIYWENLSRSTRFFFLKSLLINALLFLVLFFFSSPTYILSQMELILNLKDLGELFK